MVWWIDSQAWLDKILILKLDWTKYWYSSLIGQISCNFNSFRMEESTVPFNFDNLHFLLLQNYWILSFEVLLCCMCSFICLFVTWDEDAVNFVLDQHDAVNFVLDQHDAVNFVLDQHDAVNCVLDQHDTVNFVLDQHGSRSTWCC
jgi:hypothetical protein